MAATPQWRQVVDHVQAVPERVYETWTAADGWNNDTPFGKEFGENLVSWCVIFDWDMYHQVGLAAIVPKVDNVNVFSSWARARKQWSDYPSVGAWVNLSAGGHTEIVTGFDDTYVYTKGGNSVQAGSTDAGQGNGVWSHRTERRSTRVVGYFAPRFPDGVCPPTADPHDPRGGPAVTSWRWTAPAPATTPPKEVPPVARTLTADDIEALLSTEFDDPTKPGSEKITVRGAWWAAYGQAAHASAAARQTQAQLGSLQGIVAQLVAILQQGGTLTVEQAKAAAEAGADAALAKLGEALQD